MGRSTPEPAGQRPGVGEAAGAGQPELAGAGCRGRCGRIGVVQRWFVDVVAAAPALVGDAAAGVALSGRRLVWPRPGTAKAESKAGALRCQPGGAAARPGCLDACNKRHCGCACALSPQNQAGRCSRPSRPSCIRCSHCHSRVVGCRGCAAPSSRYGKRRQARAWARRTLRPMFFARHQRELLLQREHLIARSAQMRLSLAQDSQPLQRPAAVFDQVQGALVWLMGHPGWSMSGLALLFLLRPRRSRRGRPVGLRQGVGYVSRWAGRVWWGWQLWQRAQRWLREEPGHRPRVSDHF